MAAREFEIRIKTVGAASAQRDARSFRAEVDRGTKAVAAFAQGETKAAQDSKTLGQSAQRGAQQIKGVGDDARRATRGLEDMGRGARTTAREMDRLKRAGGEAGEAMGGTSGLVGKLQTLLLAIPVVGQALVGLVNIVKGSGDAFISFDDAMTRGLATLGRSKSGIDRYAAALAAGKERAEEFGLSQEEVGAAIERGLTPAQFARARLSQAANLAGIRTGVNPQEIAAAIPDIIAMFGVSQATAESEQELRSVVQSVAQLSAQGGVDLPTAIQAFSGVRGAAQQTGQKRTNEQLVSLLLAAGAEGRFGLGELETGIFAELGSTGLDLEQVAGLIAAGSAGGMRAGEVTSTLRLIEAKRRSLGAAGGTNIIDFLSRTGAEAQRMGLGSEDITAQFIEAFGARGGLRAAALAQQPGTISSAVESIRGRIPGEVDFFRELAAPTAGHRRRVAEAQLGAQAPGAGSIGEIVAGGLTAVSEVQARADAALTGPTFRALAFGTEDTGLKFREDFQADFFGSMKETMGPVLDQFGKTLGIEGLGETTNGILDSVKSIGENIGSAVSFLSELPTRISNLPGEIADALKSFVGLEAAKAPAE